MATTSSEPTDPSPAERFRRRLRARYESGDPCPTALGYLLLLTLAEVVTVMLMVRVGVVLHLSLLLLLMVHAAATWERPLHRLLLSLTFVPLIRVTSLTLPLSGFPLVFWYLVSGVPLFAAVLVAMNLLGFSWRELILRPTSLRWQGWLLQLAIGLSGLLLGYVEYLILRPAPLVEELTPAAIWLPALILLVSTGYLEELIFRCILQRTAVERLGGRWGIVYVAVLYAVLHIGYQSPVNVLFVLAVGLAFGLIVQRTEHLLGVTLAHGLTNISLFLLMPFWVVS